MCDHVYLLNHLVLASMISTEIAIGLLPRLSPCGIVYLNFDNLYQLYVINFKTSKDILQGCDHTVYFHRLYMIMSVTIIVCTCVGMGDQHCTSVVEI